MTNPVRIWHYGLVARWWAEFNHGGEDIEYFRAAISRSGGPVLDAGCGTGRLLLPFLRHGIDVDGSDASPDMLDECRSQAETEGLRVNLYAQAMHQLDLPRRYRSIVVCGAFGLGTTRENDREGLRRIHAHLEPGGTLHLDHYIPHEGVAPDSVSSEWPTEGDRRRASDGSDLDLRVRIVAFDPRTRAITREISVRQFVENREVASETYPIEINLYSKDNLQSALASAGFRSIGVTGGLEDRSYLPEDDTRIVFHAKA